MASIATVCACVVRPNCASWPRNHHSSVTNPPITASLNWIKKPHQVADNVIEIIHRALLGKKALHHQVVAA
jgi:hypothetical protein